MKNNMEIKFLADSVNVSFARIVATGFVAPLDPTTDELGEIKTIVSEAVTNAIIHGYKGIENAIVKLEMSYIKRVLTIKVTDYGKGIENIEEARQPFFFIIYSLFCFVK